MVIFCTRCKDDAMKHSVLDALRSRRQILIRDHVGHCHSLTAIAVDASYDVRQSICCRRMDKHILLDRRRQTTYGNSRLMNTSSIPTASAASTWPCLALPVIAKIGIFGGGSLPSSSSARIRDVASRPSLQESSVSRTS